MRKGVWLLIATFLLGACGSQIMQVSSSLMMTQDMRELPHIEKVRLYGPFDVDLHTGYTRSNITMKGDKVGLSYLDIKTDQGVLTVRCPQKCAEHGSIHLRLDLKQLRDFVYRGQGKIVGHALHAPLLNLFIQNPGITDLSGDLGLRRVTLVGGSTTLHGVRSPALSLTLKEKAKLKLQGDVRLASLNLQSGAWLSLYWFKADRLELRERGNTVIQIAGLVKVLDVELWDNAQFHGRYIRAEETFIKTHGHALAEISTWGHQHTLATDASDIQYFDPPKTQADFMARRGAVLNLNTWEPDGRGNLFSPVGGGSEPITIAKPCVPWTWVTTFSIGPVWLSAGKTQTFYLTPTIEKSYVAQQSKQTLISGEIFVGKQKAWSPTMTGQLGLAIAAASSAKISGSIWDDADPRFDNHVYRYQIQHAHLALKGKFIYGRDCAWFNPWISASVGASFNKAHGFQNTPTRFEALPNPNFGSKTTLSMMYSVGLGVQKSLNAHWQAGLGYEMANWGKSSLGRAPDQTLNNGLTESNLSNTGVMFSLTYLG